MEGDIRGQLARYGTTPSTSTDLINLTMLTYL